MKKKRTMEIYGGIGAEVINGDLKSAINSWKKQLKEFNVLSTYKSKKYYVKPSERRKNEIKNAIFLRKKLENQ